MELPKLHSDMDFLALKRLEKGKGHLMSEFVKILYINGGVLDTGGITAYMMNFYRQFDKSKIHVDFLTQGSGNNMYCREIEENGGKIYQIPNKSADLIGNVTMLYKIIKNENYDIIHSHADAANGFILHIAKLAGVKVRISHSHSTNFYTKSKVKFLFNSLQKKNVLRYATHFWGCSKAACEWLYSNKKRYLVINNAIDLSKFQYKKEKREKLRKELNISRECIALCQIGHLCYIKNQVYSIKIIEHIIRSNPNIDIKLFLVGDGEDRRKIEEISETSIAHNYITLLGCCQDVFDILKAMDVLLMPSLFEGFPVTLVESQATGLYSLVSNNVTSEVCFDEQMVKFLPITEEDIANWAEACLNVPVIDRENAIYTVSKAGFDIKSMALEVQNRYIELARGY